MPLKLPVLASASTIYSTSVRLPGGIPDVSLPLPERQGAERFLRSLGGELQSVSCSDDPVLSEVSNRIKNETSAQLEQVIAIISLANGDMEKYNGFTCMITPGTKSLFLSIPDGIELHDHTFKESLFALLELAENVLHCNDIKICLSESRNDLTDVVRSFMYVGFEVGCPGFTSHDGFVFLQYEISQ